MLNTRSLTAPAAWPETGGVNDLNWDFKELELAALREGSRETKRTRSYALRQIGAFLHANFRGLRARNLKAKHIEAVVASWFGRGLAMGTMANLMAHLRWAADKLGKPDIVRPGNAFYGIVKEPAVDNVDRSRPLDPDRLARVRDEHVRMSLKLQDAFGLRREEAMKFQPRYADRGGRIVLKASWCKGGRARWIPVLEDGQRRVLDEARRLVGSGSLIPDNRSYKRQKKVYEGEVRRAGMARMHGLRHGYAIRRYEDLTGWKAPVAGGPSRRELEDDDAETDRRARLKIARELGHGRIIVVGRYIGE